MTDTCYQIKTAIPEIDKLFNGELTAKRITPNEQFRKELFVEEGRARNT